jgi:hypothetical protein
VIIGFRNKGLRRWFYAEWRLCQNKNKKIFGQNFKRYKTASSAWFGEEGGQRKSRYLNSQMAKVSLCVNVGFSR